MRRFLSLLALSATLAGCSQREHSNPFDPANPSTQGRPSGFVALAGNGYARLSWNFVAADRFTGYQLFRRADGETAFSALSSVLDPGTTAFLDFSLQNGRRYDYRLYFVLSGAPGARPAEDSATPGQIVPWVADLGSGEVDRLTPDGRHIVTRESGFAGPSHVEADIRSHRVWVSDTFGGRITLIDPTTESRITVGGLEDPNTLAVNPADNTVWVCDDALGQALHYDSNGDPALPENLGPADAPIGIAVSPTDRSIWLCERGADRVRHFSSAGFALSSATVGAPSRVAVDSSTGSAWVTSFDRGQVVQLSTAGVPVDTLVLRGPIGIAVDNRRGRIWVCDALADQVVALRRDGSTEFRIGGITEARSIAVDLRSGEAWVAAPGAARVVRISASGSVIGVISGFSSPYGVTIDPGTDR